MKAHSFQESYLVYHFCKKKRKVAPKNKDGNVQYVLSYLRLNIELQNIRLLLILYLLNI